MKLFQRIQSNAEGVTAYCDGCGNCLEARSALGMVAGILSHLRRKHRALWSQTSTDEVASAVIKAVRRAA